MRRELAKIDNTSLNVGIATGTVFSGVVGTSGGRKEFSVLGDTVNLAARIMYLPISQGKRGRNKLLRGYGELRHATFSASNSTGTTSSKASLSTSPSSSP